MSVRERLRGKPRLVLGALLAVLVLVAVGYVLVGRARKDHEARFELDVHVPTDREGFSLALYQSLGVQAAPGNAVALLPDGDVFDALEADLRAAKSSIHVVMYIWEKGRASDRIVAAIVERARQKVACRIVIDAVGSPKFDDDLRGPLEAAGCEVRTFRPLVEGADPLARNHRKIFVIDGKIAVVGGFGVRDDWLGDGKSGWRETSARVDGPAVSGAQLAFAENWQEAGGALLPREAFPTLAPRGNAIGGFVASTGAPVLTRAERLEQLVIQAAKKRLWIENAYFIPTRAITEMLRAKAAAGVDVRLLAPGKKSDSKTSFGAQHVQYGELVEKGVRVWEYQPSMMHAKTMLVDDDLALVGSINLEPLSLRKLEEIAFVVQDAAFGRSLAEVFARDCELAERIER